MRPVCSPSSSSSASASASSPATSPSAIAAMTSARRPRRSSFCTIASTACASAVATSAASPLTRTLTAASGMRVLAEQGVQLVLEAAALDGAVDAAFLRRVRLPPPAAGAARRTRFDRARARSAADRGVALVVERVVRNVPFAHVVPDVLLVPLGERVELHDRAVVVVDLDLADVGAARPLVAAQAGDPRVERMQVLGERADLAEVAAEQAQVDARLEEIDAVLAGHAGDLVRVGLDEFELKPGVAVAQAVGKLEGLPWEPAGVDAEDGHVRIDLVGHVDQDDAVDLERRRDREARHEL